MDLDSLLANSSLLNAVVSKIHEWSDYIGHYDILVTVIACFILYKAIRNF